MKETMADSPYVVDVTAENFDRIVLKGSNRQPVLVDYWADWCAPCRMLTPILDALADELDGKLLVAKINTEEQRELAARYNIRSLPTVKLFKGGEPVDEFMGALPESEIRAFLDRHLERESDKLLLKAETLLAQGETKQAVDLLEQALSTDPGNPRTLIAYARVKVQLGNFEAALQTLDGLPLDQQGHPEVQALRARIMFDQVVRDAPAMEQLRELLAVNPDDSEARYQLAARQRRCGRLRSRPGRLLHPAAQRPPIRRRRRPQGHAASVRAAGRLRRPDHPLSGQDDECVVLIRVYLSGCSIRND